jgi:hypothetical protein
MKYVAFDLEITREIPEGADDWSTFRPLGISCAATLTDEGNGERQMRTWYGAEQENDLYQPQMSPHACRVMLGHLVHMQSRGYRIVTVNGLGFDFDVLAEECKSDSAARECRRLALRHIDIGFAMFCQKGFMVGLSAMAKGLGVAGKTEGMSGALAPSMWAESRESQEKVLEYVQQDVRATADIYDALLATRRMYWTTKRGTRSKRPWCPLFSNGHLLSVNEALELPEPDTSWMESPWHRSKFCGWIEGTEE